MSELQLEKFKELEMQAEFFYVGAATYKLSPGDSSGSKLESKTVAVTIPVVSRSSLEMGNTLIVGPPGSGKTNLLLLNLCFWKHSAVCNDIKGDIYTKTAQSREEEGQRIIVIDPKNGTGHHFNPVAAVPYELRHQLAIELVGDTSSDSFWQGTAVSFWLAAWAAADHAKKPHIPYGLEIVALGVEKAQTFLREKHGKDSATMQHTNDFFGDNKTLASNKWASVTASAQPLYNQHIINIFSGHDFDPAQIFYQPTTIYIQADETNKIAFEVFTRLVTKSIGEALIREGDRKDKKRNPVLFLYDEFGRAPLVDVMNWLDVMRARDIILVLFCQKLSQLANATENKSYNFYAENSFHHLIIFKPTIPGNELYDLIEKIGKDYQGKIPVLPVGSQRTSATQTANIEFKAGKIMTWQRFNALAVVNSYATDLYVVDPRPSFLDEDFEFSNTEPLPALATAAAQRVQVTRRKNEAAIFNPASRINLDALDL